MTKSLGVLALTLVVSCLGCEGGAASTTAPPPVATVPTTVPSAPPGFTVGALVMKDRTAVVSWTASSGAAEYIVEIGSTAGGSDLGTVSAGTATTFTLRDVRAGRSYARVKARNSAGTSGASAEANFVLPDLGEYVEGIFLGSGPLVYAPNPGCQGREGLWSAFPRGTTVRNIVSPTILPQYREAIRTVLNQIPEATGGRLTTTFEVSADAPRTVGDNQMVHMGLQTAAELQFACGSTGGSACMSFNSPIERGGPWSGGSIRWAVGYYVVPNTPFPQPYGHEPGHGILGMCHINADVIGGHERSLMAASNTPGNQSDRLTTFDIQALQAVFGSSLAIGACRADFVAAGIIRP